MHNLRPLLFPLLAPWCVCFAVLGAAVAAFPGQAAPGFGELPSGGLTVRVTPAEPGSLPGTVLSVVLASPPAVVDPPAAICPAGGAIGTLTGVIGPPSLTGGDDVELVFALQPPSSEPAEVIFADDYAAFEAAGGDLTVTDAVEGVDFQIEEPVVSLYGSEPWGAQAMTSPATGSFYGATRAVAVNLLWLAGIPLLWSAAWLAWRCRPTRRAAAA